MNRSLAAILVALAAAIGAQSVAFAADNDRRAAAREKWQNMTPEQRAAAKEKARERWDSMTPEQQAEAKKRMAERHPRAAKKLEERKAASAPAK